MPILDSVAADSIQEIKSTPGWSENLVFQVYDIRSGVSIWVHWGRLPAHPTIWEGVITCYLPGGELLTGRGFGSSSAAGSASSGQATAYCVEPGNRWRIEFAGMVRRTTATEVAGALLGDGDVEYLDLALEFDGVHPVWSAGEHMSDAEWASCRLEQPVGSPDMSDTGTGTSSSMRSVSVTTPTDPETSPCCWPAPGSPRCFRAGQ